MSISREITSVIVFSSESVEHVLGTISSSGRLGKVLIAVRPIEFSQFDQLIRSVHPDLKIITDGLEGPEKAINKAINEVRTSHFQLLFPYDTVLNNGKLESPREDECIYPILYSETKLGSKKAKFEKLWMRRFAMPNINLIGAIIPTQKFKDVGGFPTSLKVANDHLLINRLVERGVKFKKSAALSVCFAAGGISDAGYEKGLAESAKISGGMWNVLGIAVNALLCLRNGGSMKKFLKEIK